MGRPYTYPTVVEYCTILSCKDLKKMGYDLSAASCPYQKGTIIIERGYYNKHSFDITICNKEQASYIEFDYTITSTHKEPTVIKYRVPLVRVPTNIGNSYRVYFLCPYTNQRCSKLYKPPNEHYFLHRKAFPYLVYQSQLESKSQRLLYKDSVMMLGLKLDNLFHELCQKYKKKCYRGKPTALVAKIKKLEARLIISNLIEE